MKFKKDMSIDKALRSHPDVINVFKKHNMDCLGCLISNSETIEDAASLQGADCMSLLEDLNALFKEE
jgi:hybrid cluster-associated redox disulfide protein